MRARWPALVAQVEAGPSPLQAIAASKLALVRRGGELRGTCPTCQAVLVVGRESWRCLGCGAQEEHGSDQAGLLAAYPTIRNDSPRKG